MILYFFTDLFLFFVIIYSFIHLFIHLFIYLFYRERPIIKKVEKKKSVVLQCAVQGNQEIEVQWFKEGQAIDTKQETKFSVQKKKSEVREGETIVQLEIKVNNWRG